MTIADRTGPTRRRRQYAARVPLEERRTQLMDAALRVILRDGYAGMTVVAVADEAGVTKPVIYGAYANLTELFEALLDREQGRAFGQLIEALPSPTAAMGTDELVTSVSRAWIEVIRMDATSWKLFLSVGPETPEGVWRRIEAAREALRVVVASLVGPRLSERARREGVSPVLVAGLIIAGAELFAQWLAAGSPDADPEEVVATIRAAARGLTD